ncbi:MAG: CDP-diacylglycerol--glycerol-3-phosphate 3-phosphatidyltransferase, partial [Paramarteilia canceri]
DTSIIADYGLIEPSKFINKENLDLIKNVLLEMMEMEEIDCDHAENDSDSVLYPIVSFGKADVCYIDDFFEAVLAQSLTDSASEIYFTTAYVNPTAHLCRKLANLTQSTNTLNIILPNPKTSIFYKQGFIKNHIASMYGLYIKSLIEIFKGLPNAILTEYTRSNNKTYHAKGLWISKTGFMSSRSSNTKSIFTLIGSSNFNERSRIRDLELNFAIFTKGENLITQLTNELKCILRYTKPLEIKDETDREEYKTPILCHMLMNVAKSYF